MVCRLVGTKTLSEPMLVFLSIGMSETNFSVILIEIQTFSLKKMHLKMSSGKWWPFCLDLNVLRVKKTCYENAMWFPWCFLITNNLYCLGQTHIWPVRHTQKMWVISTLFRMSWQWTSEVEKNDLFVPHIRLGKRGWQERKYFFYINANAIKHWPITTKHSAKFFLLKVF